MPKRAVLLGINATLSLVAICAASANEAAGTSADWPNHGGAADESGYSQLDQIKASNVERLGLAWSLDLPDEVTLEATPLAVDGVLYFTGSYAAVYAVDGVTGKLLWKYDPQTWKHNPAKMLLSFAVNRGVAYADGRVFAASLDGRLIALDAKSGKLLWSVQTIDPRSMETMTGAPRTFNGKVIIGNAGADFGMRGYVTAYEAATGKQAWRFYTVPGRPEQNKGDPAMERAAATWSGEYWNTGTGGTVWNGMTFDAELNRIYIGTGNGAPYDVEKRSPGDGDNLYLASIVALDADTGKYVWHYQANPREAWDYKCTANIIMATLQIDGKPRKVLLQAPTNGFFYVLDRETGKLISAEKTGKVTWAERIDLKTGRPVEAKNIRYETGDLEIWPSPIGAHNWQAMSFSPARVSSTSHTCRSVRAFRRDPHGPARYPSADSASVGTSRIRKMARARCSPGIRCSRRLAGRCSSTRSGTAARSRQRAISCFRAPPTVTSQLTTRPLASASGASMRGSESSLHRSATPRVTGSTCPCWSAMAAPLQWAATSCMRVGSTARNRDGC